MAETLKIGLLGCGNVGAAVARMLHEHAGDVARRSGARIELACVAVRDPSRDREVPIPAARVTDDPMRVVRDAGIDVIVELIGGVEPARSLILAAFDEGKSVVTANKELLSRHGPELFAAAAHAGADLLYEASVGGGIPLIRPLRESLAGDRITRFMGIVNGTTNFILTRMDATGSGFDEALAEATALGYAEADPTADVDGFDAAAKAAILAGLAFHTRITAADVYREGINDVSAADVASAKEMDGIVKLLAIAERGPDRDGRDSIGVRVHPAMIPR